LFVPSEEPDEPPIVPADGGREEPAIIEPPTATQAIRSVADLPPDYAATVVSSLTAPTSDSDTEKTAALPAQLSPAQATDIKTQLCKLSLITEKNWDDAVARSGGVADLHNVLAQLRTMPASWDHSFPALTDYQTMAISQGIADKLRVEKYVILDLIGAGGMGRVYKARNVNLPKILALKTILQTGAGSTTTGKTGFEARFRREAVLLAKLNHPCIPTIYDYGEHDGMSYLVMEFIEGVDFDKYVKDRTPTAGGVPELDVRWVLERIMDAASALHYAHTQAQPIIHRDIKPSNIMITTSGDVKVLDLGIAKLVTHRALGDDSAAPEEQTSAELTSGGGALGTLRYMAPEQLFDARRVTPASDIYSLGVTLYRIVSGRVLDLASTVVPLSELRNDIPPGLDAVVTKMIERDPELRYQSMADVINDLKPFVAPEPTVVGGHAVAPAEKPTSYVGAAVALIVLVGIVTGGVIYVATRPPETPVVEPTPRPGPGPAPAAIPALQPAETLLTDRKLDAALAKFKEILGQAGDDTTKVGARIGMFAANLELGQIAPALEDYKEAAKTNADAASQAAGERFLAFLKARTSEPQRIVETFRALRSEPFVGEPHRQVYLAALTTLLHESAPKQPTVALEYFAEIRNLVADPDQSVRDDAASAKVALAQAEPTIEAQLRLLNEALDLKPQGPVRALVLQTRAKAQIDKGDFDAAIKDLQEALRSDPTNKTVREAAAAAFLRKSESLKDKPEELLRNFAQAGDDGLETPQSHKALAAEAHCKLLAQAVDEKKDPERALEEHWQMALALDKAAALKFRDHAAQAYLQVGQNFQKRFSFDRAIGQYTEAINLTPAPATLARAYAARALASAMQVEPAERLGHDFAGAIKDFQEARRLDAKAFAEPSQNPIYAVFTDAAEKDFDLNNRVKYYQRARELDKDNAAAYGRLEMGARLNLAEAWLKQSDFTRAAEQVEAARKALVNPRETEARELDRKLADVYVSQGDHLQRTGRSREAIDVFNKAISLDKSNAEYPKKLAGAYGEAVTERYTSALREYNRQTSEGIAGALKLAQEAIKLFDDAPAAARSETNLRANVARVYTLVGHANLSKARLESQNKQAAQAANRDAEAAYTEAIKLGATTDGTVYFYRAQVRWNGLEEKGVDEQRLKGAIEDYKQAHKLNYAPPRLKPGSTARYVARGLNIAKTNKYDFANSAEAVRYAEIARDESKSKDPNIMLDLAIAYHNDSQRRDAIQAIDQAIELFKQDGVQDADLETLRQLRASFGGQE
jgi:tetratricopeptide (TPR) repeat protein